MPLPTTANVDRPRALGYHARLDDLYLRLIANQEIGTPRIESIRPEATRIDTGQTPEDFVSEFGQTFSRSRFAGGEGLGFAHREESESDRFWDSEHIDVSPPDPGERAAIRLGHDADEIAEITHSAIADIASNGIYVWIRKDGDLLHETSDPLTASPTFSDVTPFSDGRVSGLAVLGNTAYLGVLNGTDEGVYQQDSLGGSWSTWSDFAPSDMWAVKSRIIGLSDGLTELHEVRSGADSVLVATSSSPWRDVEDAGSHILAASEDGYVYAFTANDDADMELVAQTRIPFERPVALATLGSSVFVGTYRMVGTGISDTIARLWRGDLASDGSLANLQLIREWGGGDPPAAYIGSLETDGVSIYIGLTHHLGGGDYWAGLWRYDSNTGGRVRQMKAVETSNATSYVDDILIIGEQVLFTVRHHGLYRESTDTYKDDGYLIAPAADFFTALDKSWLRIEVEADFPAGTSVKVSYATDLDAMDDPASGLWTSAGTLDPSSTSHVLDIAGTKARFLTLMLTLNANTAQDETPRVYSVSVTANVVGEEVAVTLPVNVSDQIELPGKRRHNVRGLGEKVYQELRSRVGESVEMELFSPAETLRGTVWRVEAPVPSVDASGSRTMVCNVEVRGVGS